MRKPSKTKKDNPIAILMADLHLSHRPPVWRSNEPDWYAAMQRPLDEVQGLTAKYGCPVFIAGDIFDKWNASAELINFAMKILPSLGKVYAIPGQHELPNHNIQELHKSAFASLLISDTIKYRLETILDKEHIYLKCFPFGKKIEPTKLYATINVALVHEYVWYKDCKYPVAPKKEELKYYAFKLKFERKRSKKASRMVKNKLYGYDVIVYGDNHKGFLTKIGGTTVFNCGTMMRRKSDEVDYKPHVGLLYPDGRVEPHYLDISKDKHLTAKEALAATQIERIDMREFSIELAKLGASALDFSAAVRQYCKRNKVDKEVYKLIEKAMNDE